MFKRIFTPKEHKIYGVAKQVENIRNEITEIKNKVNSLSELKSDDPAYEKYQELSNSEKTQNEQRYANISNTADYFMRGGGY
jgi:hypothetical protein